MKVYLASTTCGINFCQEHVILHNSKNCVLLAQVYQPVWLEIQLDCWCVQYSHDAKLKCLSATTVCKKVTD